jgi:hypothetical protein
MSSRIFRLIILISITLLAYSCGEDNPVAPNKNQDSLRIIKISPKFIQPKIPVTIKYENSNKKNPIQQIYFGEFQQYSTSINDSIITIVPSTEVGLLDSFKIKLVNKSGFTESQFLHFFSTKFDTNNSSLDFDVYSPLLLPLDGYGVTEGDIIYLRCRNLFANSSNSVTVTMNNIKAEVTSVFVKEIFYPNSSEKFNFISVVVPKLTPGNINITLTDYFNTSSNSRLIYSDKSILLKNLSINLNNVYYNGSYYYYSTDKDREPKLIDTIQPIVLDYILNENNISLANVSNYENELIYNKIIKYYRNDNEVNAASEDKLQVKIQLSEKDNLISSIFLSRNYKSSYQMSGNGGSGNEEIKKTIRLNNVECTYNSINKTYSVKLNGDAVKNVLSAITSNTSSSDRKLFWSRTIRTGFKELLNSQPPEATIEISFELY